MERQEVEARIAQLEKEISDLKSTDNENVLVPPKQDIETDEDDYIEEFLKGISVPAGSEVGTYSSNYGRKR